MGENLHHVKLALSGEVRRGQGKLFQSKEVAKQLRLTLNKKGERKVRCRHGVQDRGFKDKSFVVELLKPSTLSPLQETIKGRTDE